MKLAGALLAFLGCCAAGAVRASAARRRLDALAALCEALCLIFSRSSFMIVFLSADILFL